MPKFRLPKPISTATNEEYKEYLAQFDPTGDRRVLAEEILRLRSVAIDHGVNPEFVIESVTKQSVRKPKVNAADDALI